MASRGGGAGATARLALLLVVLLLLPGRGAPDTAPSSSFASPSPGAPASSPFAVVAYLPEWRFASTDWDAVCVNVTHLILFSLEVTDDGSLTSLDRFPSPEAMTTLRAAAAKRGVKLLLSLGGHGRTRGFPIVAVEKTKRRRLARTLASFCATHGLHGVDYNWEYPASPAEWNGMFALLRTTRKVFDGSPQRLTITMAYYPDGRQERELKRGGAEEHVELLHAMSYDHPRGSHSSTALARAAIRNAEDAGLDARKITIGLPFYGRHVETGEWKTYAELDAAHGVSAEPSKDEAGGYAFNGADTIRLKTSEAKAAGTGGVMIWEAGQDLHPSHARSLLAVVAAEAWGDEGKNAVGEKKRAREEL
jgi:GH18 family chitinase